MSTTQTADRSNAVNRVVALAVRDAGDIADAPLESRAQWLESLAAALSQHTDELVDLADAETHLGEARLRSEIARTAAQLSFHAEIVREGAFLEATIDHPNPDAVPPVPDLRRMLAPIGPVAVFAASNFPFAFSVLGGDTASAVAAGNPVVVKAHEGHPRLSRRVMEIAQQALKNAPHGLLGLVEGREAGVELVKHPAIRAVGFTGSVEGGRFLFNVAAARPEPIPFYGELGSINPVVITERALRENGTAIAAGLAESFTLGAGQFCTKPGLVFAPAGHGFPQMLAGAADVPAATMLNAQIEERYLDRLGAVAAVERVERIDCGAGGGAGAQGPVVLHTDVSVLRKEADNLLQEVFGPVTLVVEYTSREELADVLHLLEGSLTATIHAVPDDDISGLLPVLAARAGRVIYGGWPTGVAVSPAQHHGGPYPAATSIHTSVGGTAIRRFLRPIAFQTMPESLLPQALQESNPLRIPRRVDGRLVLP